MSPIAAQRPTAPAPAWRVYLFATGVVLIATGLRALIEPWAEDGLPFITYFAAVALSGWYGGVGAALFATALGFVAALCFFMPANAANDVAARWIVPGMYVGMSAIIAAFAGAARRATIQAATRGDELRTTLASIGDAVIATDAAGIVTLLNVVAERLTGWRSEDAIGQPLAAVFDIRDEATDRPAASPAERALREGAIVGLANHTVLVRRDGTRTPIDDSAAPIRDDSGQVTGCVLVFRDVAERRRAEEAQAALAAIVTSSDDAIVSKSLDGRIRSWNGAAERIFGYTAAEAIGKPILLIVPPDRHDEERSILERLRRGERIAHFETVRVARDGRRVDLSIAITPLRDGHGEIVGAAKVGRDITAQKAAARALQQSQERHRGLLELLPVAVYTVDRDGALTFYNAHAAALWGRSPVIGDAGERFCGSHRAWTPDGAEIPRDRVPMAIALREGRSFRNVEAVIERPDGSRITALINIDPLRDEHGEIVGAINAFHDTTAVKRAQEALRDSEEAFRSLVAVVTDVPWSTDVHGAVVQALPAWGNYTGQTFEQYRGHGWLDAVHADDRERARAAWSVAAGGAGEYRARYRLWHATTHQHRHVEARGTRLFDARGTVRGWIGSCTDVHEQTLAREELLAADRRKDEFLATLAHELRNPLAPVRNALEIMRRAQGDPQVIEQARDTMDRQVRLMERLMDDLLDVSRITHNRLELRRAPVELGTVLQQAVEACGPLCVAAGQSLSVRLPAGPVWLHADAMRLVQLFSNLLNNASKYTERGGNIRLDAAHDGDHVEVVVQDDGIGIPPELLPRIFEMFTQVDRTLERSRGGLGIGLTLVRQIAELHDGSVTAHSDGPGRGSAFVVRLPVAAAPPAAAADAGPSHGNGAATAPRRFVVVDDNEDAANTLAMLLRLGGDEVHVAHDGEQALAVAAAVRPAVVLLDLGLPRRNGYDVCRALRAEPWARDATIVALTGWGQAEDRRRSLDAGFDGHLVKPVDHAALMQLLASASARARV